MLKEQKRVEIAKLPLIPAHLRANQEGTVHVDLGMIKNRLQVTKLLFDD